MSGVEGLETLEEATEFLRTLGGRVKSKGVERAAAAVQEVARAEYAAGKGPAGARGAWPARKKDGAVALARPAATVEFVGKGGAIRSTTEGEPALDHHRGLRPVYPGAGKVKQLPETWGRAAETALVDYAAELVREAKP